MLLVCGVLNPFLGIRTIRTILGPRFLEIPKTYSERRENEGSFWIVVYQGLGSRVYKWSPMVPLNVCKLPTIPSLNSSPNS